MVMVSNVVCNAMDNSVDMEFAYVYKKERRGKGW